MGKAKRKKEDMWNLKNNIKIVPKIFLFDPRHISLHPECLSHPRYLSETIICTYLISKKFIGTNAKELWFFGIKYRPKGGFLQGHF